MLNVIFEVVGKKYVSDNVIHSTLLLIIVIGQNVVIDQFVVIGQIVVTEQMRQTLCFYTSILSFINSFIFRTQEGKSKRHVSVVVVLLDLFFSNLYFSLFPVNSTSILIFQF